jgi:hypothetical protein
MVLPFNIGTHRPTCKNCLSVRHLFLVELASNLLAFDEESQSRLKGSRFCSGNGLTEAILHGLSSTLSSSLSPQWRAFSQMKDGIINIGLLEGTS